MTDSEFLAATGRPAGADCPAFARAAGARFGARSALFARFARAAAGAAILVLAMVFSFLPACAR